MIEQSVDMGCEVTPGPSPVIENLPSDDTRAVASQAWVDLSLDDVRQMLLSLVGYTYGAEPEKNLSRIRAGREAYAQKFIRLTSLSGKDQVIDLGSGCGFGTRAIAKKAAHVLACDISPAYLSFARAECGELDNVDFVPIASRDLSVIPDQSVDVVISMSVFVHLNLYDIYWYFREFQRILPIGGRVCFDFANMNRLFPGRWQQRLLGLFGLRKAAGNGIGNSEFFMDHAAIYQRAPHELFGLMQWNAFRGIRRVAGHYGFRCRRRRGDRVLFVRVE